MPERARDARVKPWQQAAQGLVSVLHVVRPPTRSLCTTTASARHVPQQRHSRAGFSPSGTRSEPPARQHQSSRPIPRTRRRSRRWSRWAAIARSKCTLGACCWPSKVPAAALFRLHPHVRYQSWSQPAAEVAIARARPAAPGATHIEHLVVTDARAW